MLRLWMAIALLTTIVLCGCETNRDTFGPSKRKRQGNVLYFGGGAEPESIDPGLGYDSPGLEIARNLFEGLMRYDPKTLDPVPGMATSFEKSEDGRRYVFHLREARWTDGTKVTAHDFVYAWTRVLAPETAAQYSSLLWDLENGKAFAEGKARREDVGVKALDDRTLEVRLDRPVPWFLQLLPFAPFCPVPRHTVEKHGFGWTRVENIVSNGPFTLESWKIAYEIRLKKNPMYWDAANVALDGAVAIVSDDTHAMLRLYRAGELDWIGSDVRAPPEYRAMLRTKKDYTPAPDLATYFYWLNLRTDTPEQRASPIQDVRVRQALNLAIDKAALATHVLKGGERPARHVTPEIFEAQGYDAPQGPAYDPDRARALLREAGYGPEGKPFPKLELSYNTNESHKSIAEAIQQMWNKELGIGVELANYEWKVFMNNRTEGYFDISRAGWTGDFRDPFTFLAMFVSDAELNEGRWKNAEFDALIDRAMLEQDNASRFALYRQAEEIVNRELPVIPLYFYAQQTLKGSWVEGIFQNSQDMHPLRAISLEAD